MTARPQTVRILFVAHDAHLYGAQLSLLDILDGLDHDRFTPLVAAPGEGPFTESVRARGIRVVTGIVARWIIQRKPFRLRTYVRRPWLLVRVPILALMFLFGLPIRMHALIRLIRRERIDIVYTNTVTVLDGALAARLTGKPHIWHLRELVQGNKEVSSLLPQRWIPTLVLCFSSRIAVNSQALKARFFDDRPGLDKVAIIYNGTAPERFSSTPATQPFHNEQGIPPSAPLIAICGFIQERKGHAVFIRAAARLRTTHPEAHFIVVGNGFAPYVRQIRSLSDEFGLGGHIHFTGWRDDIPGIFSEIAILAVASEQEPFGRTVIEGMAAGKPVVSTRCGGPEEVIVDGETGFLVPCGDDYMMADRIGTLLDSPSLRSRMGDAGRKRVETCFSCEAMLRNVENLITSTLPSKTDEKYLPGKTGLPSRKP